MFTHSIVHLPDHRIPQGGVATLAQIQPNDLKQRTLYYAGPGCALLYACSFLISIIYICIIITFRPCRRRRRPTDALLYCS